MLCITMEIGGGVKPGLIVQIGGIDHQRVAVPMANGVALGQLDLGVNVRPAIHSDNTVAMHELPQHHDIVAAAA